MSNKMLLLKASETHEDFYNLIGTDVTFDGDIISNSGSRMHSKGEKAFISDVEYTSGHWSNFFSMYIEPKISSFKINGMPSICWNPKTFVEHKAIKK